MIKSPPRIGETRAATTAAKRLAFALGASLVYMAAAAAGVSALATEPGHTIDASRVLDAGALPGAAPEIVILPIPVDPAPMVERSQWVFDLRWDRDDVWLLGVQPLELPAPRETPRVMGRFALELFEGAALIERVRFDFPLLGSFVQADGQRDSRRDGGSDGGSDARRDNARTAPSFSQNLRTRIGVVFPAASRGTRLELWDRATNRRWSLPWPPPQPAPAAPAGASPADGGRG
jgi:hypothetical protein